MKPFLLPTGTSKKGLLMADLQARPRSEAPCPADERTTLMLRGIPRCCTQKAVMRELGNLAGGMHFDFFYLPWDRNRNTNMRFAFVNCVEACVARELLEKIQSQTMSLVKGEPRRIGAVFAHVQGLVQNIAHYIGSDVVQEESEHAPVIMHEGCCLTFQEAVDRFLPPDLVASQLCEADWKARSSYLPQAELQPPSGPSLGVAEASPATLSNQAYAASEAPAMPCPRTADLEEEEDEEMKDIILHSAPYAAAWSRLNHQLRGLQAKYGTTSGAASSDLLGHGRTTANAFVGASYGAPQQMRTPMSFQ